MFLRENTKATIFITITQLDENVSNVIDHPLDHRHHYYYHHQHPSQQQPLQYHRQQYNPDQRQYTTIRSLLSQQILLTTTTAAAAATAAATSTFRTLAYENGDKLGVSVDNVSLATIVDVALNLSTNATLSNGTNGTTILPQQYDIPQIPAYIRTTSMVFCITIMLLGVIGNIMVIIFFLF